MKKKCTMEAKIVMVGDTGVGKSSITMRYVLEEFPKSMEATLGAAYMEKIYGLEEGKRLKLKIWDTAGQEKYRAIARIYYKDCQIAMLVYDVTHRKSFEDLNAWAEEILKHAPKNTSNNKYMTVFAVVANKIDLLCCSSNDETSEVVPKQQGQGFAKIINASYHEVSAKSMEGIKQLFSTVSESVITKIEKSFISTKQEQNVKSSGKLSKYSFISSGQNKNKRKKCCETN